MWGELLAKILSPITRRFAVRAAEKVAVEGAEHTATRAAAVGTEKAAVGAASEAAAQSAARATVEEAAKGGINITINTAERAAEKAAGKTATGVAKKVATGTIVAGGIAGGGYAVGKGYVKLPASEAANDKNGFTTQTVSQIQTFMKDATGSELGWGSLIGGGLLAAIGLFMNVGPIIPAVLALIGGAVGQPFFDNIKSLVTGSAKMQQTSGADASASDTATEQSTLVSHQEPEIVVPAGLPSRPVGANKDNNPNPSKPISNGNTLGG